MKASVITISPEQLKVPIYCVFSSTEQAELYHKYLKKEGYYKNCDLEYMTVRSGMRYFTLTDKDIKTINDSLSQQDS